MKSYEKSCKANKVEVGPNKGPTTKRRPATSHEEMDLSVLQGADPAGYKAEEAFRKKEREENTLHSGKDSNRRVTGSIAGADSSQFHQYRKTRREEIERLERFQHQTEEEKANEEFYRKREEAKQKLAEKTERNRAKRAKKAAKMKKDS